MKKLIGFLLLITLTASMLAACSGSNTAEYGGGSSSVSRNTTFNNRKDIVVVSREDGSGTRGAFIELFGIEQKNNDDTKKDLTTKEAIIAKQTDVMIDRKSVV